MKGQAGEERQSIFFPKKPPALTDFLLGLAQEQIPWHTMKGEHCKENSS